MHGDADATAQNPAGPGELERSPALGGRIRAVGLAIGLLAALAVWFAAAGLTPPQRAVATTATLMAVWWLSEAIPLWATALLPFLAFPVVGAAPWRAALDMAVNPLIALFLGGMLLARGLENTGLHRRIALHVIWLTGVTPGRLVLGVLVAGALISMFVSNTATALMLYPIAHALVRRAAADGAAERTLGAATMLGLAYGCNAGGAACLIGTPPNLLFVGGYRSWYGEAAPAWGFLQWGIVGLPFLALFIPVAWWWLTRVAFAVSRLPAGAPVSVTQELTALGPPARGERLVFWTFSCAVLAWITRDLWDDAVRPWIDLANETSWDAIIALVAVLALLLLPLALPRLPAVVSRRDLPRFPWGILVLLAGGVQLSKGFEATKLTAELSTWVHAISGWPPILLVAAAAFGAAAASALTSNTGTAGVATSILLAAAPALGVDPRLLLFPAALGVSCDFALPVGTPPNAIAFGSGYFTLGRMARTGLAMDLIAVGLVTAAVWFVGVPLLGLETTRSPLWAQAIPR
jgi:sodium-dependent dicarboxylate transporter 2/3/5